LLWSVWLAIAPGIPTIIAFVHTSPASRPSDSSKSGELKVAIIDQLYRLQPLEAYDLEREFNRAVIIMTGCSCLYLEDLAQAFVAKGAPAYLAWDATVNLDYVDEATPIWQGSYMLKR